MSIGSFVEPFTGGYRPFGEWNHLLPQIVRLIEVDMNAHVHSPEFIALIEAEYRRAFAEYAAEVQRMQRLDPQNQDRAAVEQATRRVRDAERKYRQYRDALAKALLNPRDDSSIRSVAHAIWERAGRPVGTAESDWFRAERMLSICR